MNLIQPVYASTEETTEAPVEQGVEASLGLNGQLFVFQLINFAIVALILLFLILKPLTKKLEERRKIIDESLDKAKEVDANLVMAQQKFQEKVDEAKVEANKIIERAHGEAEQLSTDMKAKAKRKLKVWWKMPVVKFRMKKKRAWPKSGPKRQIWSSRQWRRFWVKKWIIKKIKSWLKKA